MHYLHAGSLKFILHFAHSVELSTDLGLDKKAVYRNNLEELEGELQDIDHTLPGPI